LVEVNQNSYEAINTLDISVVEFKKKLSQSKHYQEMGHRCKSNLAKALLKKSKDNIMLALELYNRPSLENKLDGFVMLFCTAWEQLLKAKLIERDREPNIYEKGNGKKRLKRTVPLRACSERLYDPPYILMVQSMVSRERFSRRRAKPEQREQVNANPKFLLTLGDCLVH
jgi:hypothetical protein